MVVLGQAVVLVASVVGELMVLGVEARTGAGAAPDAWFETFFYTRPFSTSGWYWPLGPDNPQRVNRTRR